MFDNTTAHPYYAITDGFGIVTTRISSEGTSYFTSTDIPPKLGIGTLNPGGALHVAQNTEASAITGHGVTIDAGDQGDNPRVELRDTDGVGEIPYIDFSNSSAGDFDARIILLGDDSLIVQGTNVGIGTNNTTSVGNGRLFVGGGHVITDPDFGFVATKAGGGLGAGMDPEPSSNRLRWFNTQGVEKMSLADNGNLTISGSNYFTGSDERLKTNVQPITNALDDVLALRGVTFNRVSDESQETHVGFIAQEVEQVLPEVVHTDHEGYKSVAYANIVSVLVEALEEQQKQIEALEARLAALEAAAQ